MCIMHFPLLGPSAVRRVITTMVHAPVGLYSIVAIWAIVYVLYVTGIDQQG